MFYFPEDIFFQLEDNAIQSDKLFLPPPHPTHPTPKIPQHLCMPHESYDYSSPSTEEEPHYCE